MTFESTRPFQGEKPVIPAIQYLRGIAAAMVLVAHCLQFTIEHEPGYAPLAWIADYRILGVAIFFIISGFIMYFTCREHWQGSPASAWRFLQRRLHRIVPLYWLLTFATVALLIAGSGVAGVSLHDLLRSLAFIPYDFDGLKFRPVLGVGWTLDFEMFFYLLFALGLFFPKRIGLPLILALILSVVALGQTGALGHSWAGALAQPIILLFGMGVALGWAHERYAARFSYRAGVGVLALLMLVSPAVLLVAPPVATQLWVNPALWGLSLVVVAVAAFTADGARGALGRVGLMLGNASYFLYLAHVLVIIVLIEIGERLHIGAVPLATTMLVVSLTAGVIGHLLIEKPLTRWTKPLFGRR